MYTTERYHAQISVEEYLENYVDVDTFWDTARNVTITIINGAVLLLILMWKIIGDSIKH